LTVLQPLTVVGGSTHSIEVSVGDDVRSAAREGLNSKVSCHLRIKPAEASHLIIKLNDTVLSGVTQTEEWLDYDVGPSVLKKGINKFEIAVRTSSGGETLLSDLLLRIRYSSSKSR
jgi:hypothetical protein